MICSIEKNALALMNVLAHVILRLPPHRTQSEFFFRGTLDLMNMSVNDAHLLLSDQNWQAAVVYRDPVERFYSAFASKCGLKDRDGKRSCHDFFQLQNVTIHSVVERLLDIKRQLPPNTSVCEQLDPHWAPQSCFCGGLRRTFRNYSNRIAYHDLAGGLVRFLSPHVSKFLLRRLERLMRTTQLALARSPFTQDHVTSSVRTHTAMTAVPVELIPQIRELYEDDYASHNASHGSAD